jgi:long-chain acyl-CoA synthetase
VADVHWLWERLQSYQARPALIWKDREVSYAELLERVQAWRADLASRALRPGACVALQGDYNPETCALLIALVLEHHIVVPIAPAAKALEEMLAVAGVDAWFEFADTELARFTPLLGGDEHPLKAGLREHGSPGLILFSSGSTGKSKASLLDFQKLLAKFKQPRPPARTLTFLLLDHIGGINTLLYALTSGGTIVPLRDRTPKAVCQTVERHRIQLLPTTPTFLNMLLISEAYRNHDLSSLELITYGTEPMPSATLQHLHRTFPEVKLKQTYGLSELGILQTKSKDSGSLWVKVGGEGYEIKVVDNVLWIRSEAAMLGYLNAPSPFDAEGWFNTGDAVEVDGEYVRILGRKSEIINVGGEKVYPAEVESVILELPNVADVTVTGKPSPITGQVVIARVALQSPESLEAVSRRLRRLCRERLAPYKVPVAVELVEGRLHGDRFKKARVAAGA